MGKNSIILVAAAVAATIAATAYSLMLSTPKPAVIFSAPTLRGVSDELSKTTNFPLDVHIYGSVFASNLIKSGRRPDLFLTVDSELKYGLPYRNERVIGVYRLVLVCTKEYKGLDALKSAKIGLADPNQAPIGYRALAAMYLISSHENPSIIKEVEKNLNIRYVGDGQSLTILVGNISASGRFYIRPNLDLVGSLLEGGVVDCIFANVPFVILRNFYDVYNVFELPQYARFDENPPIKIVARLSTGDINVVRFEAAALSFTEKGDELLRLLYKIDVEKHGIKPIE